MVSGYMLYALILVMIAIGLHVIASVYRALVSNSFKITVLYDFLVPGVLYSIVPLLVLNYLMPLDSTGIIIPIFYYVAALGVFIDYLGKTFSKFR